MDDNRIVQLRTANGTWFSRAVTSISQVPYNNDNFMRYLDKNILTDYAGRHMQFIQKRWFPTVEDDDEMVFIDARYQYRPDIIAVDYYNSPLYAWAILSANGIRSVFELKTGMYIRLPKLARVLEGLN